MQQIISKTERRLLLTNRALANRSARLFAELASDDALREAFIDTPAEVIGREILGEEFTPAQASAVNRFIYSVLANDALQKWVSDYGAQGGAGAVAPTRQQRIADVANAFVKHGDQALMTSLIEMTASGVVLSSLQNAALILKTDSVAIGNWFVYKVSGRVVGDEALVLPPAQVEAIATALLKRARELQQANALADANVEIRG